MNVVACVNLAVAVLCALESINKKSFFLSVMCAFNVLSCAMYFSK